jgi:hypothetical protein
VVDPAFTGSSCMCKFACGVKLVDPIDELPKLVKPFFVINLLSFATVHSPL